MVRTYTDGPLGPSSAMQSDLQRRLAVSIECANQNPRNATSIQYQANETG